MRMPSYMGVSSQHDHSEFMSFGECSFCGEVQTVNLLKPKIIYEKSHNREVVGKIWEGHFNRLSMFIGDRLVDKKVLEIGDPSGKLLKLSSKFKKWTIIDPNCDHGKEGNVERINGFFEDVVDSLENPDIILHSHLLEHAYFPMDFMKACSDKLLPGQKIIFSIPNMEWLLENATCITNILHFEHTYYIDDAVVNHLARSNSLKIVRSEKYKNHSVFYELEKVDSLKNKLLPKCNVVYDCDTEVFIFGAHVNTQQVIQNNPNLKIAGVLDNSPSKIGQKLYGSGLDIFSPEILSSRNLPVICSHIGPYKEEIETQLKIINKDVVIL